MLSSKRVEVLKAFCTEWGLNFKNFELLNRAFCHTSYIHENNMDRIESYERLEFLGDAVLKLVISDILFFEFPNEMEGLMTERRAAIVSDKTIAKFAEKLNFKDLILTGKGENPNKNKSVFACSFEALLGAIYIEEGYLKARGFLLTYFKDEILNVEYFNPKAQLQELTQKLTHNLPRYVILDEKGPDHDKIFTSGVYYEGKLIAKGEAKSRKLAETNAAKQALIVLMETRQND